MTESCTLLLSLNHIAHDVEGLVAVYLVGGTLRTDNDGEYVLVEQLVEQILALKNAIACQRGQVVQRKLAIVLERRLKEVLQRTNVAITGEGWRLPFSGGRWQVLFSFLLSLLLPLSFDMLFCNVQDGHFSEVFLSQLERDLGVNALLHAQQLYHTVLIVLVVLLAEVVLRLVHDVADDAEALDEVFAHSHEVLFLLASLEQPLALVLLLLELSFVLVPETLVYLLVLEHGLHNGCKHLLLSIGEQLTNTLADTFLLLLATRQRFGLGA